MDGQCQDKFLHRTDPGREQERINVTFRWIKQHVSPVLCLRQGWHAVCQRVRRVHQFLSWGMLFLAFFWAFWFLLGALCKREVLALLVSCGAQGLGFICGPPAGHELREILELSKLLA